MALISYVQRAGLLQFGGVEWMCSLTREGREAILADLYNRAVPPGGVHDVSYPYDELRNMLRSSGMSEEIFMAYAEQNDFDNIPVIMTVYLALYFDVGKGQFSAVAFDRQYNCGNSL